jgi:hypothetical protein
VVQGRVRRLGDNNGTDGQCKGGDSQPAASTEWSAGAFACWLLSTNMWPLMLDLR